MYHRNFMTLEKNLALIILSFIGDQSIKAFVASCVTIIAMPCMC